MADAENKPNSDQPQRKFSQQQYDMLKRCSDKRDVGEWNKYREKHQEAEIWLQGANLSAAYLPNADLTGAHLENANLRGAHLENANLRGAHLENAEFQQAHLGNAKLTGAHLEHADFTRARLEHASLEGANLQAAIFWEAKLRRTILRKSSLQKAELKRAHLQGAEFGGAKLQGTDFSRAIVDGETLVWDCKFDRKTKFEGVALGNMRIYPKEKQAFEYNIRRMNWEQWYKKHPVLRWPVRWFWSLSNYGLSTWRVIIWFFVLSFLFAAVYSNLAYWFAPGVVNDLYAVPEPSGQVSRLELIDYGLEVFFRPIYFSVVTMTTLGFGDMYARPGTWLGHVLLMVQVILGYVLLGALVTRFAVLFTAGGPAGTFSEPEPQKQTKPQKGENPKQ